MKICKSCGQVNEEDSMFCVNCGTDITGDQIVEKEKNKEFKLNFFKSKKGIIISAVALLIVLATCLLSGIFISKEKKVILGTYSLFNNDKNEGTVTVSIDGKTGIDEVDSIIKKSAIELKFNSDVKKRLFALETSVNLGSSSLIDANVATTDEALFLEVPELYDEYFYVEFEDEYLDVIEEYYQLLDYFEKVDLSELSSSKYISVLSDKLSDVTDKQDGQVVLSLSVSKMLDILSEVCSVAKDDEKLAKSLYKSIEDVLKEIEKDDFTPDDYNIAEAIESLKEFVDEVDEDDFIDGLSEILDTFEDELNDARDEIKEYGEDINFDVAYDFGMFNKVNSVTVTFDLEEITGEDVKIVINSDFNKGAKKASYSTEKGVDIMNLDYDEQEEITTEISNNFIREVAKNKEIEKIIENSGILEYSGYNSVEEMIENMLNSGYMNYYMDDFYDYNDFLDYDYEDFSDYEYDDF